MIKKQYLKIFEKNLKQAPKSKRKNIVDEVKASMENFDDHLLEKHFGSPETLAKEYLQNLDINTERKTNYFSTFLKYTGLIFLLLLITTVAMIYWVISDKFNYTKHTEAVAYYKGSYVKKLSQSDIEKISVKESFLVIYFSMPENKITCKYSEGIIDSGKRVELSRKSCMLELKEKPINFDFTRSTVILINPKSSFKINSVMSNIELTVNQNIVGFDIDSSTKYSSIDLPSNKSTEKEIIKIEANMSSLSLY